MSISGFFGKLLGKTAEAPISAIGQIVDNIHTSDLEELEAKTKLEEVRNSLVRLQAEITLQEASHRSIFVAGWRPGLMWMCIAILGFNYIGAPILIMLDQPVPQIQDQEHVFNLIIAAMGLAGLRTMEKAKGLTR